MTIATVSPLGPTTFSVISVPTLPLTVLSDEEKQLVTRLNGICLARRVLMEETNAYYEGEQRLTNLGIAIPRELESLRTVIGWPALAVDPIVERLDIEGFRLPGALTVDDDLWELWDGNDMPGQFAMGETDAHAMGSSWVTVGSAEDGGMPLMRVESPLNMAALWDGRTMALKAVWQTYLQDEARHAVLYVPGESIYLSTDESGVWQLVRRDRHGYGIPVERIVNRPRTHDRDGRSEITPFVRQWTDAACRALLQLQVAGEIYSVPRYLLLGATEADFQDKNGNPRTVWETYITKLLAIERDDEGEIPSVVQLQAYDPAVFTKVLDFYASKLAGPLRATPQDFGIYTEGNPPSADSVQFAEGRRDRYAERKQTQHGPGWVRSLQHVVRFANGGKLPADMTRIDVDWAPVNRPSLGAIGTYIQQMVTSEVLPATSDVTRKLAGLTPIQRAQLAHDEQDTATQATLTAIGDRYLNGE